MRIKLKTIIKQLIIANCSLIISIGAANAMVQDAWNNPNANMAGSSVRPGFAQLTWAPGTVMPIRLRNGMVTMINFPQGEIIESADVGDTSLFRFESQRGGQTLMVLPEPTNMGGDTNLIVVGRSGNIYLFYLRTEPANAAEITYSQVDIVIDPSFRGHAQMAGVGGPAGAIGGSALQRPAAGGNVLGVDGEDFGWIRSMRIDPSEFRFDLDIFVPNPDDFVIAPERVWRDRIFTYIDFGDKVIAMTQRPVVSLLIEGGESPVGFRTDGEHGRLLIVEAVGDLVLRSGQRLVCIRQRRQPFLISDTASVMALAQANVAQSMWGGQSLNNAFHHGVPMMDGGMGMMQQQQMMMPTMVPNQMMPQMQQMPMGGGGMHMIPSQRTTAGSFLPGTNVPLVRSNQAGVAVELRADTSVRELNDYWTRLLAQFAGTEGEGLLAPFRDRVFFAVDETGVGELGTGGNTARLYRLRIGPIADINEAQLLCDRLHRFRNTPCHVVRIQ